MQSMSNPVPATQPGPAPSGYRLVGRFLEACDCFAICPCWIDEVADEVTAAGGRALAVASDLTDRESIAAFADAALTEFGRCDVVCNIGIYQGPGGRQLVMDTELDELLVSFEADVVAPVLLVRRALPSMLATGDGTVCDARS